MTRFSPAFVGLCFLLGACSGAANDDSTGAPEPTAGSAGVVGVAGDSPAMGGLPEVGGAPSVAGGGSGGDAIVGGTGGEATLGGSGGSAGTGGSLGGGAGAAGSAGKPPIDFSIWQLQLPTGSGTNPDTVSPKDLPTYSSAYFKKADDGGYVFMDPKTGITTSGSQHPRSEFRESNATGGEAAWTSSGTNIMTVTGKVMLMSGGTKGSTTVAQVFVSGSNTLLELQYNGSQFKAFYEEAKGNPEPTVTLSGTFPMNTKYTFIVNYSANVLTVSIGGKVLYTKKPSSAVSGKKFYFKVGNYDQTADPGTPSTTPYTQVEAYTIDVEHS